MDEATGTTSKGLGAILWDGAYCAAAALQCPDLIVKSLHQGRQTQIIPMELLAAAGLLLTFQKEVAGRDIIFWIDNQSVLGALTKGSSSSHGIHCYTTGWHAMATFIRCRIWLEWVPSHANPADELSRAGTTPYQLHNQEVLPLELPRWADRSQYNNLEEILTLIPDKWRAEDNRDPNTRASA